MISDFYMFIMIITCLVIIVFLIFFIGMLCYKLGEERAYSEIDDDIDKLNEKIKELVKLKRDE